MAEQTRKQRTPAAPHKESTEQLPHTEHKSGEELKADMDDLLDEIDGVLEENAEEFVESYVQKGGQ